VCGAYVWGRHDAVIAIATHHNTYSTFVTLPLVLPAFLSFDINTGQKEESVPLNISRE